MDSAAFDSFLSLVDDALALAKSAVENAEQANAPQVTLTKVAHDKCVSAAKALHRTGAFRQFKADDLARSLSSAGETGLIEMMEKLASSAVFPIADNDVRDGDLVEKSGSNRAYEGLPSRTAAWQQAFDEAEEELG